MALEYQTIKYKAELKKTFSDGTTEMFKDLLQKTWDEWPDTKGVINPIIVNEFYVGRPDLISLAVYGTDAFGDMICKYNGISNPFDINEGMLIQIPPMTMSTTGCENRERTACELLQDGDSIQEKDETKTSRDAAHSSSTALVGAEPPFIIDKTLGVVLY